MKCKQSESPTREQLLQESCQTNSNHWSSLGRCSPCVPQSSIVYELLAMQNLGGKQPKTLWKTIFSPIFPRISPFRTEDRWYHIRCLSTTNELVVMRAESGSFGEETSLICYFLSSISCSLQSRNVCSRNELSYVGNFYFALGLVLCICVRVNVTVWVLNSDEGSWT